MVFLKIAATILCALLLYMAYIIITTPKKKLHVKYYIPMGVVYGVDMNWIALLLARMIPDFLRKKYFIRSCMISPRQRDVFETDQKDPYTINELEKDKVWMVTYKVGVGSGFSADTKTRKLLDEALELCDDDVAREQAEKDWQKLVVSKQ